MNDKLSIINRLLDWFKLVLVRFKNAGFGIFFIKNLFILPEFFKDREANVFSKIKIVSKIKLDTIFTLWGPKTIENTGGLIIFLFL